jgi:hypothetical protein
MGPMRMLHKSKIDRPIMHSSPFSFAPWVCRALLAGLGLIFAGGCADVPVTDSHERPPEAYRIGERHSDKTESEGKFDGYPIISGPVILSDHVSADLRSALNDSATYLPPGWAKGCTFNPGVGIRYWHGGQQVDVLICFSCDEVKFINRDKTGAERSHEKESDPGRPRLLAIVKKIFPADAEIQSLPPDHD